MSKSLLFLLVLFTYTGIPAKTKVIMQKPADTLIKSGPYALVAGGSTGIGYAIAEALAKRQYNLVLIARDRDNLSAAKIKLESAYGIQVELLSYDLSREESAIAIANWCIERNIPLKMLCNVAGSGGSKDFQSLPPDTLRYMIRLNVESCVALSLALQPLLEKNARSYILNVASMAGFSPIPAKNVYAATKSAVIFFSYALHHQLKDKNIGVSCLAPGPVFTKPEIEKETKKQLGSFGEKMAVPASRVGEIAVQKTLRGKMMIVPGTLANAMSSILRILPKKFTTSVYDKLEKK
jgi:short-subunit dehydrogenase